jgi:hypothetical protein
MSINKEYLKAMRDNYFDQYQWNYDPKYRIARDYKSPGNLSEEMQDKEFEKKTISWQVFKGNPVAYILVNQYDELQKQLQPKQIRSDQDMNPKQSRGDKNSSLVRQSQRQRTLSLQAAEAAASEAEVAARAKADELAAAAVRRKTILTSAASAVNKPSQGNVNKQKPCLQVKSNQVKGTTSNNYRNRENQTVNIDCLSDGAELIRTRSNPPVNQIDIKSFQQQLNAMKQSLYEQNAKMMEDILANITTTKPQVILRSSDTEESPDSQRAVRTLELLKKANEEREKKVQMIEAETVARVRQMKLFREEEAKAAEEQHRLDLKRLQDAEILREKALILDKRRYEEELEAIEMRKKRDAEFRAEERKRKDREEEAENYMLLESRKRAKKYEDLEFELRKQEMTEDLLLKNKIQVFNEEARQDQVKAHNAIVYHRKSL